MTTQALMKVQQSDLDAYRQHYAPQSSPDEWALFVETCQAYGLSPMRRQIYLVSRSVWNPKTQQEEWKATPQVSIEGLRDIAARTNKYQGRVGPFWKSKTGQWSDCWNIDDGAYPYAAKVGIWKEGFREPLFSVVYFHEMAQYAGKGTNRKLNKSWGQMGIIMLAKCAEAASIRAAFPETSGLYIHEEMQQANVEAEYAREVIRITPEPDSTADAEVITGEIVPDQTTKTPAASTQQPNKASQPAQQKKQPQQASPDPKTPGQMRKELQAEELMCVVNGEEHLIDWKMLVKITARDLKKQGTPLSADKILAAADDAIPPHICKYIQDKLAELVAAKKAQQATPEAA